VVFVMRKECVIISKGFLGIIAILSISVVLLMVYVFTLKSAEPICNRKHIDDDLRLWGKEDVVPDKETAVKIANVVLAVQFPGVFSRSDFVIEDHIITATVGVDKVVCLLGRSIFDKHPREHNRFPFTQYAEWVFRALIREEDAHGGENGCE